MYDFCNKNIVRIGKRSLKSEIPKGYISTSWKDINIKIVPNSSLRWDNSQGDAINYGNLIHEILSKIILFFFPSAYECDNIFIHNNFSIIYYLVDLYETNSAPSLKGP